MSGAVADLWLATTLGQSFQTVTGNTPPKSRMEFYGDDVPLVKPPELTNGDVSSASDGLTKEGSKFARLAPEGSTLVSCIGNLGKVGLVTTEVAFNQQINAIFPNAKIALPRFIYFLTLSPQFQEQLSALSSGTTVPIVNKSRFNSISLALPPLDEQKRIVAVLDQAFAALDRVRAHAEANIDSARELFERFLETTLASKASDWEQLPLSSLGATQTGSTPKTSEAENYGDFIPFIKPGDFKPDGSIDLENQGLSEVGAKKARAVPAGSALMVCIGATIGKSGFTETAVTTNQQINSVAPRKDVSGEFLYYQFISSNFQRQVLQRSGQATLPIINKSKWSEIEVGIPSDLGTQLQIVKILREMRRHTDQLIFQYKQKLADLADLRQSLLQKAFSGELT